VQTVQLQCGSWSNMMAISVEHLGAQVQCPHCAAVVQTPPRSALGPPPGSDPYGAAVQPPAPQYQPPQPYQPPPQQYQPQAPNIQVPERESIFADPEPSEDLFGGDTNPKVHMPDPIRAGHPRGDEPEHAAEPDEEPVDLTAMRSRMSQERKAGSLAPTILVFLVPYSIFTTLFLAYLLYTWPRLEAFEWLPDPKKGNAQRVVFLPKHDAPLPAKLKVPLKETIRIGQMEITPLKVARTPAGDLVLEFKAKNVSNILIRPLDDSFFAEGKADKGTARPFTFLERQGGKDADRAYGGDKLEFRKGEQLVKFNGDLMPGQECVVHLATKHDDQIRVQSLIEVPEGKYLWRLQVRRGTAAVHGVDMMLTAVIGIEFEKSEIGT
jgi:hypothetical protein